MFGYGVDLDSFADRTPPGNPRAIHDERGRGQANLVPDAHLAALAVEYGLILCSTDGDFARLDGLRWIDPLKVAKSTSSA